MNKAEQSSHELSTATQHLGSVSPHTPVSAPAKPALHTTVTMLIAAAELLRTLLLLSMPLLLPLPAPLLLAWLPLLLFLPLLLMLPSLLMLPLLLPSWPLVPVAVSHCTLAVMMRRVESGAFSGSSAASSALFVISFCRIQSPPCTKFLWGQCAHNIQQGKHPGWLMVLTLCMSWLDSLPIHLLTWLPLCFAQSYPQVTTVPLLVWSHLMSLTHPALSPVHVHAPAALHDLVLDHQRQLLSHTSSAGSPSLLPAAY